MIFFYSKDCKYRPSNQAAIITWLEAVIKNEKKIAGDISIVFCSDKYLHSMNVKFLNHHYFTDIITFDYSKKKEIHGDLFISIDRLRENATKMNLPLNVEVWRVIVHGVLHLCGYSDKSIRAKKQMTAKEDFYLNLF